MRSRQNNSNRSSSINEGTYMGLKEQRLRSIKRKSWVWFIVDTKEVRTRVRRVVATSYSLSGKSMTTNV